MASPRIILTYRDYAELPNDGRRYEIHDGELCVTPAPRPKHQEVLGNLFRALGAHVMDRHLGKIYIAPIDVILSDTSIVQPDLVFVATDRLAIVSDRAIEGPPTLVVEVLSPSTGGIDRQTKMQLYARYGIPWYWIVDPDSRELDVYGLEHGSYLLRARTTGDEPFRAEPFPELRLPLPLVWA